MTDLPFGPLPEGWRAARLEELSDFITKGATPTTYGFDWTPAGQLFLRSECIAEEGFQLAGSQFISAEAHRALSRSSVQSGDLLITITGNVGRTAMVPDGIPQANINQHIARVRIASHQPIQPRFIEQVLRTKEYRRYFERIVTGLAYPQISLAQVRGTWVPLPPLGEQRKIAAILSSLDNAIESAQAVIDQLGVVKKAMMAELLTRGLPGRHTRFKQTEIGEIPEEWEVARLADLALRVTDGTHQSPPFTNTGVHFLLVKSISSGRVLWEDTKFVSPETYAMLTRSWRPARGDVLYTAVGATYGVAVAVDFDRPFTFQRHIAHIRPKKSLRAGYLSHFLNSALGRRQADLAAVGNAQPTVTLRSLASFWIGVPPTLEQETIENALGSISAAIDSEVAIQSGFVTLKSALMSVLLTGEVRVKPDEDAA